MVAIGAMSIIQINLQAQNHATHINYVIIVFLGHVSVLTRSEYLIIFSMNSSPRELSIDGGLLMLAHSLGVPW